LLASPKATWAGLAQTAGDLMAAIAMKLIPVIFSSDYDPDKSGRFRRFLHHLTSEPYNLTFILFTWVLFNFGMTSPILPIAVVAQILMGTTYVSCLKKDCERNANGNVCKKQGHVVNYGPAVFASSQHGPCIKSTTLTGFCFLFENHHPFLMVFA